MVLYIDKENIISFIDSKDNQDFGACENLIRNNMDVHYNFPKSEIKDNEKLLMWFRAYAQGVKGEQSFSPPEEIVPARVDGLKANFYKNFSGDQLSSIYLLNDEHICNVVALKSCLLIGSIGQEIDVVKQLLIDSDEVLTKQINWAVYSPKLPLTDIIICDNHYFKKKSIYTNNDHAFIRSVITAKDSPVNLVIIVKQGEIDKDFELKEEAKTIKKIIREITGNSKSSATILTSYKTHDRVAITNYCRIKNGSCFHIKDNGLKGDCTTEIKVHSNRRNFDLTKELLSYFQEIADNPVQVFGDKKSNYLSFAQPV